MQDRSGQEMTDPDYHSAIRVPVKRKNKHIYNYSAIP